MLKKNLLILLVVVFSSLGLRFALSAQKYSAGPAAAPDYAEDTAALEAKIGGLNNDLKSSNREILRKLDQVLSNQEKIFQELAVIKVRASKR
ncbi:hypothetical protein EPN16_03205 [bacterium]|nr:MAG: hypothetical protein EPN16_03205 [bacterium]